jgi:hypothetical protein
VGSYAAAITENMATSTMKETALRLPGLAISSFTPTPGRMALHTLPR